MSDHSNRPEADLGIAHLDTSPSLDDGGKLPPGAIITWTCTACGGLIPPSTLALHIELRRLFIGANRCAAICRTCEAAIAKVARP